MSSTGMTRRGYLDDRRRRHCPPGRTKSQCSYSCGFIRGIDSAN
ncbi:hypothetical protein [Wolbachia endosymbiont (group A) of Brachyopa scutellaris]